MEPKKCDACGAPIQDGVCVYCGKVFPEEPEVEENREPETQEEPEQIKVNIQINPVEETSASTAESNKRGCWKTLGWIFLWLCFWPILGIYYVVKSDKISKKNKQIICIVIAVLFVLSMIYGAVSEKSTDGTLGAGANIYDSATVVTMPAVNGETWGEVSVIHTNGSVAYDDLKDWYFNYVLQNNYKYCLIVDDNSKPLKGVYADRNQLVEDVRLIKADDGYYKYVTDSADFYEIQAVEQELNRADSLDVVRSYENSEAKDTLDAFITEDYKGPKYGVELLGLKQRPDLRVVLENGSMTDETYETVVKYVADHVKDSDLTVGSLVVVLQPDDSTVSAIGVVSDMSAYASETDISVTTY